MAERWRNASLMKEHAAYRMRAFADAFAAATEELALQAAQLLQAAVAQRQAACRESPEDGCPVAAVHSAQPR